jgi:cell division protein FtsB
MSNCTIKGCTNAAVAGGLCAMHYMRKRRRGDPEAAFKPGRQPKPRGEDRESAALKRENTALREEVATLKRELAAPRAGVTSDEEKASLKLAREVDRLKAALATAEAKLAADPDEVGKLEKQLKGWKTRAQNAQARERIAWEAAKAKGLVMSKGDKRAMQKALHPDSELDPVRKKALDKAAQIFNALPIHEPDQD